MTHQLAGPDTGTIIPLIGRDDDLARVQGLLAQPGTRLVTITGMGGVGKTALALAVAARVQQAGWQRVVVAELAPVTDTMSALPAIARSAGLVVGTGDDLADRLARHLDDEPTLLVLDNLEHLDAAPIVADLLAGTTRVTILAASRTRLRLSREREYRLAPLPVPESADCTDELAVNPAAMLLVERIRESQPSFTITAANSIALRGLSRRLEGIPLAIELAASHGRVFSVAELLGQFKTHHDLLRGGAVDQPDRQRTMDASVAWSLDLLPASARTVFRYLCVFRGEFDFQVARLATDIGVETLELLADHGLLTVVPQRDEPNRFRILVPIREQVLLDAARRGDLHDLNARHAAVMFEMAAAVGRTSRIDEASADLDRLARSSDDFLAALEWDITAGDALAAIKAGVDAHWLWTNRLDPLTSTRYLGRLCAAAERDPSSPPSTRAGIALRASVAAYHASDWERSGQLADDAIVLARECGALGVLAPALVHRISLYRGRHLGAEAQALVDEAAAAARSLGVPVVMRELLYERTALALDRLDYDEAERLNDLAIAHSRLIPVDWDVFDRGFSALMAIVHAGRGEYDLARACFEKGLANPNSSETARYTFRQGLLEVDLRENRPCRAAPELLECLEARVRRGSRLWINAALIDAGWLAVLVGDNERAAELFGFAGVDNRENIRLQVVDAIDRVVASVVERMGESRYRTHYRLGAMRRRDDVVAETLAWLAGLPSTDAAPNEGEGNPPSTLTRREREVLARMARGESNRQIAAALYVGNSTVETHVKRILRKLGVQSRTAAVATGIRQGLIDPPEP